MDKDKNTPNAGDTDIGTDAPKSSTTRRKFSAGAAAGAGVLLTLGNRVAWGTAENVDWVTKTKTKTKTKKACISERVWESYINETNASFDPKGKHSKEVSKFQAFFDNGVTGSETNGTKFCAIKEEVITYEKTKKGGPWERI